VPKLVEGVLRVSMIIHILICYCKSNRMLVSVHLRTAQKSYFNSTISAYSVLSVVPTEGDSY
jgi:hypothetical protein